MFKFCVAVVLCSAFNITGAAVDKNSQERCFLAIPFGNKSTASIQLSNLDNNGQTVIIERYSASGRLLDNITKSVPPTETAEVRIDLSSDNPELGWIRVLSKDTKVGVALAVESLNGNTLTSIPQGAAYRHPVLTKQRLLPAPHTWTFDVATNSGFLMYFVNLSEYPVKVAMCQDDVPACTNPTLPYPVAPMASITFPLDQTRRYAVIESTPGYSVATAVFMSDGNKRLFKVSSCIKFEGSACSPDPQSSPGPTAAKFITPLQQTIKTNMDAARSSPAFVAANPSGLGATPEELAEVVRSGKGSKCVIVSEPPGAEIYVDGLKLGVTPVVFVLLRKDTPRTVEIRMQGYRTVSKYLVPDGKLITIAPDLEK